jgi:small subunit ribosomal protein S20
MPQRRSSIKALRQTRKKQLHNQDIKTSLKKTVKQYVSAVKSGNTNEAQENLKAVYKKIDKATKVKVLNKNTAARKKSRLSKLIAQKAS